MLVVVQEFNCRIFGADAKESSDVVWNYLTDTFTPQLQQVLDKGGVEVDGVMHTFTFFNKVNHGGLHFLHFSTLHCSHRPICRWHIV